MKAMNTIKKFGYKILRKFGIVGKEYQLLPSNFPVANINTTFNQIGKLNPRVTHPTEYVVLGVLASITKQNILEVGCYLGYSSCIMASAISSDRKIFSVDRFEIPKNWSKKTSDNWIFKNYSQIEWATKNRNALGFESKITFVESDSKSYAAELRNMRDRPKFDLIFIDGDHSYEGCLSDMKDYMPMLEEGGYLVMHDYNSPFHPGVAKAVDEIIQSDISFKCLYLVQSLIVIIKEHPKS